MSKRSKSDRGTNARALALDILAAAGRKNRSVEELLAATLKRQPLLQPERAFLLELVQGVKRWELKLDYLISQASAIPLKKLHPMVLLILRLAAYQLLMLDKVPARAAVHEAVLAAKARRLPPAYGGFINAVLRRLAADEPSWPDREADPVQALSVAHSHPAWLVRRWLGRWGLDATEARLAANNRIPPLTIRVNTLKTDTKSLQLRLAREGMIAEPCRFSPSGLRLTKIEAPPLELPSYREGLWIFQDEAAQLVSLLLPAAPGSLLLELGAGRGGKTTHLAEKLGGGVLLAVDQHQGRLRELASNLRRWGAGWVQAVRADAAAALPVKAQSVDSAVLDAPCSALGILRRHPEIKTRLTAADLDSFPARQRAMLTAAAAALRPGGRLLYITCTTEPAENEGLIDSFLAAHREFRLATDPDLLPAPARSLVNPPGYFRTSPAAHGLDGFFGALLTKQ
ncbi:MAG: 16S rRNA (cytosine(967)-C(5))-methyltransferase RsmB [Deltaproteobacteria bacterium]|nr:16S rRNA (cytosine(967)-C(5))-methyltransferase RsmB [Deltaproteobacteria bacterium]